MTEGIPCTWMRGGTSKGAYFLKQDLPDDADQRDALLLSIMGSPDPRQIDGIGGADPLTSKVAVVSGSERPGVDVEYLFLQVFVDQAIVTDKQNCGNILAGVGPFAVENGLVPACDGDTELAIYMVNSDQVAMVTIQTPGGVVTYRGDARIEGVPGTGSSVPENFPEASGSTCGALLPTGRSIDVIDGVLLLTVDGRDAGTAEQASRVDEAAAHAGSLREQEPSEGTSIIHVQHNKAEFECYFSIDLHEQPQELDLRVEGGLLGLRGVLGEFHSLEEGTTGIAQSLLTDAQGPHHLMGFDVGGARGDDLLEEHFTTALGFGFITQIGEEQLCGSDCGSGGLPCKAVLLSEALLQFRVALGHLLFENVHC